MTFETIAENAIGLFLEFRDKHGHSEEDAKVMAVREVVEGTDDYTIIQVPTLLEQIRKIVRRVLMNEGE